MKLKAKRIIRNYCQVINSTPETIFPLLCPVKEKEWLDGWSYKLIYSQSGFAEEGAIFTTSKEGEEDTAWIITVRDNENHKVEFVSVTPKSRASSLKIKVRQKGFDSSFVDIKYTHTSLSSNGDNFIDNHTEKVFLGMMKFWEDSMNYFLKTGEKLKKINDK